MRYITSYVLKDLERKMVFIGGPRQVGKTTLAKAVLKRHYPEGRYFNWDFDEDRQAILKKQWLEECPLLIFDELHKYPNWKRWIKGIYDVLGERHRILVTGSARLDVYRRGGDSLPGRYHYWRLHPFSMDERPQGMTAAEAFRRLMTVGGFPEPFMEGDERFARRWRRERFDRVIREDVRDIEHIKNIQLLSLLVDILRTRVGSSIVFSNIAEDLQVAHKTVKNWLSILERMYLVFVIPPLTKQIPRAIMKPPKVYFFDNGDVQGDEGARFENFVAATLLKQLHFLEDMEGYRYDLHYIRDKEGRDVDFAVLKEGRVEKLIEVKYGDRKVSRPLRYYAEKLKPKEAVQIVAALRQSYHEHGVRVVSPLDYFNRPLWG